MKKIKMIVKSNSMRSLLEYVELKLEEKQNGLIKEVYNEIKKAYVLGTTQN